MNEDEQQDILTKFQNISNKSVEESKRILEFYDWNLEAALERFLDDHYFDQVEEMESDVLEETKDDKKKESKPSSKKENNVSSSSRVHTLHTLKNDTENSSDSDDDNGAEAFYAGGSERSGQQILGPHKNTDMIKDMFKTLKERGAEVVDMNKMSNLTPSKKNQKVFCGVGFKLGQTNDDSEPVPGPSTSSQLSNSASEGSVVSTVLRLWKNGFTVNDSELRIYNDPDNQRFLQSIMRGEIPTELLLKANKREVHINMEDHHFEEYVPNKNPKLKAFSGQGHVLGNIVPKFVSNEMPVQPLEQSSSFSNEVKKIEIDSEKPITMIQIRLRDGSKLSGQFNHSHTISDIKRFIIMNKPEYESINFNLIIPFPRMKLDDENKTIAEANLMNSTLTQDIP